MARSLMIHGTEHSPKKEQSQVRTRELESCSSTDGDGPAKVYRPLIIRAPVIVALLVVMLCLIALIEYACRSSPTEPFHSRSSPSANVVTLNLRNVPEPSSSNSPQQMKATSINSDTSSRPFTSRETAQESKSSDAYVSASSITLPKQTWAGYTPQPYGWRYMESAVSYPVKPAPISAPSSSILSVDYSPWTPEAVLTDVPSIVKTKFVPPVISDVQSEPFVRPSLTITSSVPSTTETLALLLSSAATALDVSLPYMLPITTSIKSQSSRQVVSAASIPASSVKAGDVAPSTPSLVTSAVSYFQSTMTADHQSGGTLDANPAEATGLDYRIFSAAGEYLPAATTSPEKKGAILNPSITAQNQPHVSAGFASSADIESIQAVGGSAHVSISPVQRVDPQYIATVSDLATAPGAWSASAASATQEGYRESDAIIKLGQKTNLRITRPATIDGAAVISLRPGYEYTTTNSLGSTIILVGSVTQYITRTSTDSKGKAHTDVLVQGTPTVIVSTDATGGLHTTTQSTIPTQTVPASGPNRIDRSPHDLTVWTYFLASYLPILLALLLRILVGMIYAAVKMLEPFITLSNHSGRGVLAKDFLNINYLATNDHFDPIAALFTGHWFMLFTTIFYGVSGFITPFASEFASIYWFCNSKGVCGPEMRVKSIIGRIIEALLSVIALMLVVFLFIERKYRSGIFADPSSIATMIALFHQPQVVENFQEADAKSSKREMQDVLARKRYSLNYYRHEDGSERYGLVFVQQDLLRSTTGLQDKYARLKGSRLWRIIFSPKYSQRRKRRNYYRILREVFLGLATSGILIIVVWYYNNSDQNNRFEKFMDSDNFGPRFVFSVFGIILQAQWKRIERETCIIQPFRSLIASSSPASKSILIGRALDPLTSLLVALPRRHVYCTLVALTSLLAEVLIVALSGVPFSSGQLQRAFCVSAYVAIGILSMMLLMQLALLLRRPRAPDLPRTPNTVGAVLSYLCGEGSRALREDFAELATLGEKEKRERVEGWGRRYVLREGGRGEERRWEIVYDDNRGVRNV